MRQAGCQIRHIDLPAPVAHDSFDSLLTLFVCRSPWILRMPDAASERPERNQGGRPLGIGGGEEDRHAGALRVAKEGGALRPGGVHHRAHVVHSLLQRREVGIGHSIGHPGASLVEKNQAAE